MEKPEFQKHLLGAAFSLIEYFERLERNVQLEDCDRWQSETQQALSELSQAVARVKEFLRTSAPPRDVEG